MPKYLKIRRYLICLLLITLNSSAEFNELNSFFNFLKKKKSFIENKGQIIDQNNKPNPGVIYLLNTPGFNVQLRRTGFSYDLFSLCKKRQRKDELDAQNLVKSKKTVQNFGSIFRFHRIDFNLLDCNPNCEIISSLPSSFYLNYYTSRTPVEGITFVRSFEIVTYKNIYTNIDLEFFIDEDVGFKYNFIIYPGGDINDISIQISGAEQLLKSEKEIMIKTRLGDILERIPYSVYIIENDTNEIACKFRNIKETIFKVETNKEIPDGATLIIDPIPTRIWGTYYGGEGGASIASCAISEEGDVVIAGTTASSDNIATTGAHQATYSSGGDAFLVKFSEDGTRQWGTYYGGLLSDVGNSISFDKSGYIYLAGTTRSSENIATPGAFNVAISSTGTDGFLARFDPDGVRSWGTYYGGYQNDEGHCCVTDDECNIYLTGETNSPDSISTPGSYQPIWTTGGDDAYLVKFDSNGQRHWGTYYGGSSDDYSEECAISPLGYVTIGGFTSSLDNISSPGAHQTIIGGNFDGFIATFTPEGTKLWSTYYGGAENDFINGLAYSMNDLLYFVGRTSSTNNIATPGSFQSNLQGVSDALLVKFNENGERQWGTYYGGTESEGADDCAVNDSGYIYFTGNTISSNNIATPDAFKPTYSGYGRVDAYLIKFDSIGQRKWGTYYGDTLYDYGYSVALDSNENVFLAGKTDSQENIATNGSHQPNHIGIHYNGFLVRFSDCSLPDSAELINGPDSVCINTTNIQFNTLYIPNAVSYLWNVPPGITIASGQYSDTILVDFGPGAVSGYISVRGVNPCGEGDSTYLYVVVQPRPIPTISGCDSVCEGISCDYFTESGNNQYQWDLSTGGVVISGGTQSDTSVTIQWNATGNQWLSVNYTDTNGCEAISPSVFNVEVTPGDSISVDISSSIDSICEGSAVTFTAHTLNTGTNPLFQWFINGVDTNHNDSILTYIPTQSDTAFCIVTSFEPCRSNNPDTSNILIIHVFPILPVSINIDASENPICSNDTVTLTGVAMNGGFNPGYQWYINGNPVGLNDSVYSYVPSNGDQISCILTSSEQCTSNNPATSDTITMIVIPLLPVGISISASNNPVCEGLPVTFTATPVNGGANPTYQWQVNGINVGTNNPDFTYTPVDGDLVTCTLESNAECITNNPATSNSITMSVGEAPDVSFAVCFDTVITLNAKPFKLKGGIPLGGTYSGTGVSNGYFYPGIAGAGSHQITYSYTNYANCEASATINVFNFQFSIFNCGDSLTDIRDNNKYPTIQIGSQCWMAANLNYGVQISGSQSQRDNCIPEKYCFNNIPVLCALRSALYQWDELMRYEDTEEIQGLCPPGWHVPSEADWNQLFAVYQGNAFAGSPLLYTGYSGFNVLLAGVEFFNQSHRFADFASIMWSSTSHGPYKAWSHGLNEYNYSVSYYPSYRSNAFSVRCVLD